MTDTVKEFMFWAETQVGGEELKMLKHKYVKS